MVIVAVNKVEPHILNMLDPITDNPDTKVIWVSDEQKINAEDPTDVTVDGIVIEVNCVNVLSLIANMLSPITVRPEVKITWDNEEHWLNAEFPIMYFYNLE